MPMRCGRLRVFRGVRNNWIARRGLEGQANREGVVMNARNPIPAPDTQGSVDRGTTGGLRGFFKRLGPGLITGAADDDPSGIGTHSQVGAQFGYGLAWTFVLSFPLMVAIQQVAAEIGEAAGGLG